MKLFYFQSCDVENVYMLGWYIPYLLSFSTESNRHPPEWCVWCVFVCIHSVKDQRNVKRTRKRSPKENRKIENNVCELVCSLFGCVIFYILFSTLMPHFTFNCTWSIFIVKFHLNLCFSFLSTLHNNRRKYIETGLECKWKFRVKKRVSFFVCMDEWLCTWTFQEG